MSDDRQEVVEYVSSMVDEFVQEAIVPIHNQMAMDILSFRNAIRGNEAVSATVVASLIGNLERHLGDACSETGMLHGKAADCAFSASGRLVGRIEKMRSMAAEWQKIAAEHEFKASEASRQAASVSDRLHALTSRTAISPEVRMKVFSSFGGQCFYCGHDLAFVRNELVDGDLRRVMHVDHIVPKSCGGPDHEANFIPSCEQCNIAKGDKSFMDFVQMPSSRIRLVVSK